MNLLKRRYFFFALSLLIILPGLIVLATGGISLSIDFTGGSLLEVTFAEGTPLPEEVLAVYDEANIKDPQVQTTDAGSIVIRSEFLDNEKRDAVLGSLEEEFGEVTVLRFDSVGPSIGDQVTSRAAMAVSVSSFLVLLFIAWSFRSIKNGYRYGISAIFAMLHDVAIIFSITALGGLFFDWEIDALFLTALLTVIGFSMQDSIVVFDRIRENSKTLRHLEYETLINHSIVQTLQRSINTQLMTVEFLLLALALFGGVTLQQFVIVLLIGLMSGTYSSIFVAAPVLVVWENEEWKTWFKKDKTIA
ncbi:MAG: protein translocase subunit SecF [Chloroflexi bacterium]|nr:MAG: protein translocase subunit SecF [Chloroflexota bacterium]